MTESSARDEIMLATYEALCEHGYTDLTAQAIADQTDKSKSLLFYHYDSIEDLVVDCIDFLLERVDDRIEETHDSPPVERLERFIDWFLYSPGDDERVSFHTAMLELRAQAPYNERYRDQLRKSDAFLRETLEEILRDGYDAGEFREHDSEQTAALLIAAIDGARTRQLTLDRDAYLEDVRDAVIDEVLEGLLTADVEFHTLTAPDSLSEAESDDCDGSVVEGDP